ncbi:hypothetical protein [Halomonas piscis]|uniref:hypothetical protein n=1 Tax=Halomonas piscis TaxID=3031727 RepID=UPI0028965A5B|nr:hypothetical protein [Halomonas piscis]
MIRKIFSALRVIFYISIISSGIVIILFLVLAKSRATESLIEYTSIVSASATVAIAILTLVLAIETWRMRNQQYSQIQKDKVNSVRPLVVVELAEGRVINDRMIVIKNLGRGIAFDVNFEIAGEGRCHHVEDKIINYISEHGFIKRGMRNLGIHQIVESHAFLFNELGEDLFEACINIHVIFKDIYGNQYDNRFSFDMSEYENTNRLGGKPENERNDHLKQISKTLSKKL